MTDHRLHLSETVSHASAAEVADALDSVRPMITLAASAGPAGGRAAATLFALLSRLFPHTEIAGADPELGPTPWGADRLSDVAARLRNTSPVPTRAAATDLVLGIGDVGGATIYVGGDDWTARLSRAPLPVEPGRLGLGLQAAATLAASELTKVVLGPLGMTSVAVGESLTWNLVDYRLAGVPETAPATPPTQARRVVLFGGGSVGSSAGGALTMTSGLEATFEIVDGDTFDPTRNPFRYPASTADVRGSKARWIATMLEGAGYETAAHDGSVASWVRTQQEPGLRGLAVSSVDTVEGRLEVADVLAETTISIGVDGLALHAQREHLGDDLACPYCDFVGTHPVLGQADAIAQEVGLPVERVIELQLADGTVTADDVAESVTRGRIGSASAGELVGRRLADLIRRAYAETAVPGKGGGAVTVVAPHVSWIAGVLAAAEIAKYCLGLPLVDRRVDLDLSGVPGGFCYQKLPDPTGRCVCWSGLRRRTVRRLYGRRRRGGPDHGVGLP